MATTPLVPYYPLSSAEALYQHLDAMGFTLDILPKAIGVKMVSGAARRGSIEWVRILLEGGVDPNYPIADTPLHAACVNSRPVRYATASDNAVCRTKVEIVRLLIEYGAHVNARNDAGMTPLIVATSSGSYEIVKLLLRAGADVPTDISAYFTDTGGDIPVDQRICNLLEEVVKEVTKVTLQKRLATLIILRLRIPVPIERGIAQDILQRPECRVQTLDIDLESIIAHVDRSGQHSSRG
jgi:Ankyrin repeats (3 copies)